MWQIIKGLSNATKMDYMMELVDKENLWDFINVKIH